MAKLTLDPILNEIHGKQGRMVFRRTHSGGMSLIKLADMSKVEWSDAQQAHRQRFKQAVAYARSAMKSPQLRSRYEETARRLGKRPFDLAVSDYFKSQK